MKRINPRPRDLALEHIQAYILENNLQQGDSLPPEREMCAMWNMNRCTLRSALAVLSDQGILNTVQGSGSTIAPRFKRTLQDLQGFSEYAASCGLTSETRLLSVSLIECAKHLSRRLHLTIGQKVWRITRLRLLNGQPVLIETSHIPYDFAPDLDRCDLVSGSLFAALMDEYGLNLDHGDEKISITTANDEEARHLHINSGDPVFFMETITENTDCIPIEFCSTVARADKFELASTLIWEGTEIIDG